MTAHPPTRATQLRIALALVLLEHKPDACPLPQYLASLRERALRGAAARVEIVSGAGAAVRGPGEAECRGVAVDMGAGPVPHLAVNSLFAEASSLSPALAVALAPLVHSPHGEYATQPPYEAGPSQLAPPHPSAAQLLAVLSALQEACSSRFNEGDEAALRGVHGAWAVLERVASAVGALSDEPVRDGAVEEGMRTRGRAGRALELGEKVGRAEVERELLDTTAHLLSHALTALPPESLATALAPLAHLLPLLVPLALAPALLGTAHALLAALLSPHDYVPSEEEHRATTTLARLAPVLSLAQVALAPRSLPTSPALGPLRSATDALVRLVGGYGVDVQLRALVLPGLAGVRVEEAVLGVLERAWEWLDAGEGLEVEQGEG